MALSEHARAITFDGPAKMAASSAFRHRRDSPSEEADGRSSKEDACWLETERESESGSGSAVLPRLSCPELDLRELLRKL